jgi:hypothetical protein
MERDWRKNSRIKSTLLDECQLPNIRLLNRIPHDAKHRAAGQTNLINKNK